MIKLSNKIIFDKNSSIKLFISKIFYNLDDNYKNKKGYCILIILKIEQFLYQKIKMLIVYN